MCWPRPAVLKTKPWPWRVRSSPLSSFLLFAAEKTSSLDAADPELSLLLLGAPALLENIDGTVPAELIVGTKEAAAAAAGVGPERLADVRTLLIMEVL